MRRPACCCFVQNQAVLAFTGCRNQQPDATRYCENTGENIILSAEDTQELQVLLDRSNWSEFAYCECYPCYKLTLDGVEYRFEALIDDPVTNECISFSSKGGVLPGMIPKKGTGNHQRRTKGIVCGM